MQKASDYITKICSILQDAEFEISDLNDKMIDRRLTKVSSIIPGDKREQLADSVARKMTIFKRDYISQIKRKEIKA